MIRIEFDSTLETGDQMVDSQHRTLIGMFNDLYDATVEGRSDAAVSETLLKLSDYVDEHFAAEQQLMMRTNYAPEHVIAHLREHQELTAKTRELIAQHSAAGLTTMLPLATLLGDWLANHIRKSDRALVAHVKSVSPATA